MAPLSPRAGPFFSATAFLHGWHAPSPIVEPGDSAHIARVAETRAVSSSLGPRFAALNSGSYPPPSILVHRQSAYPPPLLSAPLSIWLRPYHQAPTSVGASFFAERAADCCAHCMADMCKPALLTERSKPILALLLVTPLRSSSLGPASCNTGTGSYPPPSALFHRFGAFLLPCAGPLTSIWLRPYHQAPTSVGASFFARGRRIGESAWQHFPMRVCVAAPSPR